MGYNESIISNQVDTFTLDELAEEDEPTTATDSHEYREASVQFLRVISTAVSFIVESNSPHVAAWSVAYGIGLAVCEGVSVSDRASSLGVSPQALSKQIKAFQHLASLPPSSYMYSK